VGEVRALKPGMGGKSGNVGDFLTASLADYVTTQGEQPAGAVLVWMDHNGAPCVSWYDMDRHGLAYVGAFITQTALDE
jgi:hypothetical protein